jgi:glyoxylase I family protein
VIAVFETIHHASLPVRDLGRSKAFYGEVLELEEIERPPSSNPGAWFRVGDKELHLIENAGATFRAGGLDSQDIHLAIRISSYHECRNFLHSKGFHPDADDEFKTTIEKHEGTAGWAQIYVADPDGNVIEFNAAGGDEGSEP